MQIDRGVSQSNNACDTVESYDYDVGNRLTRTTKDSETQNLAYHANGNILTKTGNGYATNSHVGTFSYSQNANVRPHAVTSAGSNSYVYNANGSMIRALRNGSEFRTVEYAVFNKPIRFSATWPKTATARFEYGPDRNRYMRVDNQGINNRQVVM